MKVELIDYMGSDLSVVNAARVSFDKRAEWDGHGELKEADKRLIQFLARGMTTEDFEDFVDDVADNFLNREDLIDLLWQWRRNPTHFTPFAHPHVSFRIEMPIFTARQLEKHQVGFVWSEVSRRYVDEKPTFFRPEYWRKRADNIKQGSSEDRVWGYEIYDYNDGKVLTTPEAEYEELLAHAEKVYTDMIEGGMCPEQARIVLPQSMMTMWIWTGSLYGWANVYNQRKPGSHAQREVWPFAQSLADHMGRLFPVSWEALTQ